MNARYCHRAASPRRARVCATRATAQDCPARQVTLVLPFAPGGAIDIFARAFAQKLSDKLGKPFVVENRPGAGTVLAANSVARAPADGHTVLVSPSPLAINATLYKKLPYDTANDFMPVAYVADIPLVLVVHPSLPVKSIPDLIKYAKDNPGKLSYASSGTGTTLHLSGEMLKSMTGIADDPRAYKGGPPALNDVVAGHVQLVFADPSSAMQQIKAGRVRAARRSPRRCGCRARPTSRRSPRPACLVSRQCRGPCSWRPPRRRTPIADRLHAELTGAGGHAGDARAGDQARHGSRHITVARTIEKGSCRARSPAGASSCTRPASPARNRSQFIASRNESLNIGM